MRVVFEDADKYEQTVVYDRERGKLYTSYEYLEKLLGKRRVDALKIGDSVGNYNVYAMCINGLRLCINPLSRDNKRLTPEWIAPVEI